MQAADYLDEFAHRTGLDVEALRQRYEELLGEGYFHPEDLAALVLAGYSLLFAEDDAEGAYADALAALAGGQPPEFPNPIPVAELWDWVRGQNQPIPPARFPEPAEASRVFEPQEPEPPPAPAQPEKASAPESSVSARELAVLQARFDELEREHRGLLERVTRLEGVLEEATRGLEALARRLDPLEEALAPAREFARFAGQVQNVDDRVQELEKHMEKTLPALLRAMDRLVEDYKELKSFYQEVLPGLAAGRDKGGKRGNWREWLLLGGILLFALGVLAVGVYLRIR